LKTEAKFSLKDHLFNPEKVNKIASEIAAFYPAFDKERFVTDVLHEFPNLELKERIYHIAHSLNKHLPIPYSEAVKVLLNSLPAPCNPNLSDNDFGDFIYAPHSHFIVAFGCNKEHVHLSLNALEQITTRCSAEDAIRYFINAFPEETMAQITEWTRHPHYHVRRLASEGTRPKLPWCIKINLSPEQGLPILNKLYSDSTRFVIRSVANHLNDISKSQPELVIETLKKWQAQKAQNQKEMDFIIRHSLRTLIKNGHAEALKMMGVNQNPSLKLKSISIPEKVEMNTNFHFSFELAVEETAALMIDYIIVFKNKKGETNSKKVFKLKSFEIGKNESINVSKKHMMRQFMTTRTLYPGKHEFALQINGQIVHRQFFDLN
jgi:3-methyladenine DNA glycosylase AlkC